MKSGFSSSLGITILRFPGSLALYVIVDDFYLIFIPGDHLLQKRMLLIFFEQQVSCIQVLLQVPVAQFVRHLHIHSVHITGVSDMRHTERFRATYKEFPGFL